MKVLLYTIQQKLRRTWETNVFRQANTDLEDYYFQPIDADRIVENAVAGAVATRH